jgi:3-oxoacyl-[acyl-carrier protein] reductase
MDLEIAGKVALITGASRGLGFAAASALGGEGCRVVVCGRDRARIEQAAAQLGAHPVVADMATVNGPDEAVAAATAAVGPVDILVANAGGPAPGGFMDVSDDDWERAVQQNLLGTVRLMRAAVPAMRERGWGRIITITSRTVREAIDGLVLSNATRAGVAGAVRTLARELAPHGVTVNNVLPGSFATERLVELYGSAAAVAERGASSPMGRIGDPDELGAVVAFLASRQAAYLTGASILVDGGESHVIA